MKKFRLLSSLIAMVLCIASLTLAVFASLQVTYTLNGTMRYEVKDCFISVATDVYYSTTPMTDTEVQNKITSLIANNAVSPLVQQSTSGLGYNSLTDTASGANTKTLNLEFSDSSSAPKYAFFVIMSVTNLGSNTVNFGINSTPVCPSNVYEADSGIWTVVAKNVTKKVIVAFSIINVANNIAANATYSLVLQAESNDENAVLNSCSISNGVATPTTNNASLNIPAYINGEKVTSVNIPSNNNLTEVTLPATVTTISQTTFQNCSNLQVLNIPYGVTTIEAGAFAGLSNLTSITIPDSVTSIGKGALAGCSSLESVSVPFVGTSRTDDGTVNSLFGSLFEESTTAANGYTLITQQCRDLSSSSSDAYLKVLIPTSLKEVTVTSATQLSMGAFSFINTIEKVIFAETCSFSELLGKCNWSNCSPFISCSSLKEVVLNSSITTLNGRIFEFCSSLEKIIIPINVTTIPNSGAFYGCYNVSIYVEHAEKPDGWYSQWNYNYGSPITSTYWYSATSNTDGSHWHYVNGEPVIWA